MGCFYSKVDCQELNLKCEKIKNQVNRIELKIDKILVLHSLVPVND